MKGITQLVSTAVFICCIAGALSCTAQNKSAKSRLAQTRQGLNRTSRTKALLQGTWWGQEYDEHAVFLIDGDSINYIEHFDKFRYKLSGNTFDLATKQLHYKEIILKLTKDSLIFKEVPAGTISRYWKGD
ncbi:MAG: hypothetical protein ACXVPQ_12105 [Bacteroidia bacterium]